MAKLRQRYGTTRQQELTIAEVPKEAEPAATEVREEGCIVEVTEMKAEEEVVFTKDVTKVEMVRKLEKCFRKQKHCSLRMRKWQKP